MTPHTLSDAEFTALARGHGDHAAVARLRSARYSKRLVLLRALHDAAHERGLAEHFLPGYTLLADIQRTSPAAVRTALLLPQVGSWAAHTLRRLHTAGDAPAGPCGRTSPTWARWPSPPSSTPGSTARSPCPSGGARWRCPAWAWLRCPAPRPRRRCGWRTGW